MVLEMVDFDRNKVGVIRDHLHMIAFRMESGMTIKDKAAKKEMWKIKNLENENNSNYMYLLFHQHT
jgi:hypothetical protein